MPQQDVLNVLLQVRNLRRFVASMGEASAAVRNVGKSAAGSNAAANASGAAWAGAAGLVARGAKAAGFAMAATAYEAVKMGVGFDQVLTRIQTTTGATASEVDMVRDHILRMNTIFKPQQLAEATRYIEAIGARGSAAMAQLDAANEGAAISGANVVETARTLAAIMRVRLTGALGSARDVMASVNAVVGTGAITLDEFNHAMGQGVLPIAKTYGLTFQDVAAALSVFTDEHIRGSSAMAQFATGLHFLIGSTSKAKAALKTLGMTSLELGTMLRSKNGLLAAGTKIDEALIKKFGTTPTGLTKAAMLINDIFPAGRGRVLQVLLNQMVVFQQKLNQQAKIVKEYDADVAKTHQTAAYKITEAWRKVEQQLIRLYDNIKGPAVASIIAILAVAKGFIDFMILITNHGKILKGVLVPLAAAWIAYKLAMLGAAAADASFTLQATIQGVIRLTREVGFLTAATALFDAAAIANPFGLIALGIAAVVGYIVWLIMNFDRVKRAFGVMGGFIISHWKLVLIILTAGAAAIPIFIISHFNSIVNFFKRLPGKMAHIGVGMWNWVKTGFKSAINWVLRHWNGLQFHIPRIHAFGVSIGGGTIGVPDVPLLAQGGHISWGGAAVVGDAGPEVVELPAGATVRPLTPTFGAKGSKASLDLSSVLERLAKHSRRPIENKVYMDGKLFYRTMSQYAADGQARG